MKRRLALILVLIPVLFLFIACGPKTPLQYSLSVQVQGQGIVHPNTGFFAANQIIYFQLEPQAGWSFSHWGGRDIQHVIKNNDTYALLMDRDISLIAVFSSSSETNYDLNVRVEGRGSVSPNSGKYSAGSLITFDVRPETGWFFSHWGGTNSQDVVRSYDKWTLQMNGNKDLIAIFQQNQGNSYNLDVVVEGMGFVEQRLVSTVEPTTEYPGSSTVMLTAIAESGWSFKEWFGDANGTQSVVQVRMDSNKRVIAVFEQSQRKLTIDIIGKGIVEERLLSNVEPNSEYPNNSVVRLFAKPNSGWSFKEWQGDASGTNVTFNIELNRDMYVKAIFVEEKVRYDLTIKKIGQGRVKEELIGSNDYEKDSLIRLTATPEAGWKFLEWRGDEKGKKVEIIVEMDRDKEITAVFEEDVSYYYLDVSVKGKGRVSKSPDCDEYNEDTEVTLTAIPDNGWVFKNWSGDVSGNNYRIKVTMDSDKTVVATFEREELYSLNVDLSGNGRVTKSPDYDEYDKDTEVTLTATPDNGWVFKNWSGDASGSNNTVKVRMDSDKTVVATFERDVNRYNLNVNISGNGSVSKDPNCSDYEEGTKVTLTATPSNGWEFSGWSGDLSGSNNQASITMDRDKSVTATFTEITDGYTLSVSVASSGGGTVDYSPKKGAYKHGDVVTIVATPNGGYKLIAWLIDNSFNYGPSPLQITMVRDTVVRAYFDTVG